MHKGTKKSRRARIDYELMHKGVLVAEISIRLTITGFAFQVPVFTGMR